MRSIATRQPWPIWASEVARASCRVDEAAPRLTKEKEALPRVSPTVEWGGMSGVMARSARERHRGLYPGCSVSAAGTRGGRRASVVPSSKTKLCAMLYSVSGPQRARGNLIIIKLPWTSYGEK